MNKIKNKLGKCKDCNKPLWNKESIRCKSCYTKAFWGENHPLYGRFKDNETGKIAPRRKNESSN